MTILQLHIKEDNITDKLLKVLQPYSNYFTLEKYTKNEKKQKTNSDFVEFFRNSPLKESDIELHRDNETYKPRIEF
jgi:hypothetical protein